jgi:hypothetical protein
MRRESDARLPLKFEPNTVVEKLSTSLLKRGRVSDEKRVVRQFEILRTLKTAKATKL